MAHRAVSIVFCKVIQWQTLVLCAFKVGYNSFLRAWSWVAFVFSVRGCVSMDSINLNFVGGCLKHAGYCLLADARKSVDLRKALYICEEFSLREDRGDVDMV